VSALVRTTALYAVTACCEIAGCYLVFLWLRRERTPWLVLPAAASLGLFAYLLTLHPFSAGRTYAAYGGVYVVIAIFWLWAVEGVPPHRWDLVGAVVTLLGMAIIAFAPR
jgi:small multidrug resistance family-3 protein